MLSAADLMPKNSVATRVLYERAAILAAHELDIKEQEGFVSYIKFRLGANERYGISYHYAKEVMQHTSPEKVPFVPNYIAGVINHRGALLPVLDLKQLFHIQPGTHENTHIILIHCHRMTVGFLVDGIEGNDAYDPMALETTLACEEIMKPGYIEGLHQGITAIINVEAILADIKIGAN